MQLILGLKTSKILKPTKYQLNITKFTIFHSQNTLQTYHNQNNVLSEPGLKYSWLYKGAQKSLYEGISNII